MTTYKILELHLIGPSQGEVRASFKEIGTIHAHNPTEAFELARSATSVRRDRLAVEGGGWEKAARRAAEEWQNTR